MYRMFVLAVAFAVVAFGLSAGAAEEKKEITIKDVMKAHKEGGAREATTKAVKGKDWEAAEKASKEWAKLAEALVKCKCPKGDAADWKKQTTTYANCVKTLAKACADKDAKKANGALAFIGTTCGKCHKEHK